ncbi:protein of unknown function [Candidatus Methylomirabilis oxygeniifera]|uniref:Uncharacterized protein n=1 Tax=Methylomirabilis oxygeniifera TaxID=671143 RepID=D5MJE8_METO1|nr:protein of unknown function [Candidatus Methylomirabilis oxyfera]
MGLLFRSIGDNDPALLDFFFFQTLHQDSVVQRLYPHDRLLLSPRSRYAPATPYLCDIRRQAIRFTLKHYTTGSPAANHSVSTLSWRVLITIGREALIRKDNYSYISPNNRKYMYFLDNTRSYRCLSQIYSGTICDEPIFNAPIRCSTLRGQHRTGNIELRSPAPSPSTDNGLDSVQPGYLYSLNTG